MIADAAEILQIEAQKNEITTEKVAFSEEKSPYIENYATKSYERQKTFYKRNTCIINLAILMVLGTVVGALLNESNITHFFSAPYIKQDGGVFVSIFTSSILDIGVYVGVVYLLGFSAVSLPFTSIVPFIKGLGIGFNLAVFASSKTDLLIPLIQASPYLIISSLCVIIASKECIGFSYMLFELVSRGDRQVYFVNPIGAKYSKTFLNIALVSIVVSAINALIFTINI